MKHKILMLIALIFIGALNEVKSQSLSSSKEIYLHDFFVNETIVINFSDGPGNAKDWIGIYKEDQLPGIGDYLTWSYVDGTQSGNTGKKSGAVEFDDFFVPGTYKAYLLEDNDYTILASSSFKITDEVILENAPPSVEGQSVNVDEDGSVSITLKGEDDDGDDLEFTVVSQPKNGTLSGSAPNLNYSPKANFNGDDSFTYKANDGEADSNTATIAIKIIKKDVEPSLTMSQPQYEHNNIFDRELIVINFSDGPGNATDWIGIYKEDQLPQGGDYLTWSYVDGTQSGDTGKKSGSVEFNVFLTPGTYKAYLLENNGFTILASSSFKITEEEIPENTPPSVEGQSVNVDEDGSVSITLKGEDDDGDDLEFTVVSQPKNGTLSGSAPNLTYSPKTNFNGDDSFTYKANDGEADSNTATVAIKIIKKDVEPSLTMSQPQYKHNNIFDRELIVINFSDGPGNATDWIGIYKEGQLPQGGDYLTWSYVDGTQSGDTGKKSGSVEFNVFLTPGTYKAYLLENNGFTILASSSFKITEEEIRENTPPSVEGQSVNVDEDGSVSITLKAEDDDGDDLEFTVVSQPKNGTLSGSAPNLTYSPKANFNGDDSFTFKANDGEADSNTATVAISVKTVNDLPVVFGQSANVDEDGSVSITLKAQDNDGDNLKFTVVSQPENGTLNGSAPNFTYSPKANFNGDDSFTFKVFDGEADSNTATVAISVKTVNDLPVVFGQSANVDEDESVSITLKAQDNDGDNLEFTVVSQPKNGTLSGSAPNLTYSPKANFNGDDSFTFKVFDGVADSNTATVAISVKTVNDIPVVFSQSANVDEDGSVLITLKGADDDGDDLEFTVVSQPKNGTLSGSAPNLTYSPKANFNGDDSFAFKVFDGVADSNTATVAISVKTVNDLPVVFSQSANVDEDGSVSITLKAEDNDGDNLEFTVVSQPKNGTLSGSAPNLTYSPKANFNGDDSFTFKVFDGLADSNTATVAISVKSVNDLPVVFGQSANVDEDGSVSITLKAQDNDGDNLEFTVVSQPKNGTLSGSAPNLTYSPKANFNGDDSFTFKVFDGLANSNTATVAISVKGVAKPKVMLSKTEYLNNEKIRVDFSGGPGNKKDWIGIFRKGQKPGGIESVQWNYVDGTESGTNGKSFGLLEFNSLTKAVMKCFFSKTTDIKF